METTWTQPPILYTWEALSHLMASVVRIYGDVSALPLQYNVLIRQHLERQTTISLY